MFKRTAICFWGERCLHTSVQARKSTMRNCSFQERCCNDRASGMRKAVLEVAVVGQRDEVAFEILPPVAPIEQVDVGFPGVLNQAAVV